MSTNGGPLGDLPPQRDQPTEASREAPIDAELERLYRAGLPTYAHLGAPCPLEELARVHGAYFTADELAALELPEPNWAVPGLVPEGLTVLAGAAKMGKSWWCLGLAVDIATGGKALGELQVDQGTVLYAALEDNRRRLQERLDKVLGGRAAPMNLHLTTRLPRMPELIDDLDVWLHSHGDTRLVIIDVFQRVRPPRVSNGVSYADDYDDMGRLKEVADKHRVAILLVHHLRKLVDNADVFNEITGSAGIAAAADAALILKRARNTKQAELHVTGRDINEASYAVDWSNETARWTLSPDSPEVAALSSTRRTIMDWLSKNPWSTPKQIAEATGFRPNNVQQTVARMSKAGQLENDGGRYATAVAQSVQSALSADLPFDAFVDNTADYADTTDSSDTDGNATAGSNGEGGVDHYLDALLDGLGFIG